MVITSKWPGNCRDCGTRFAEGTQVEWQKGKGASCCNVPAPEAAQTMEEMWAATQEQAQEWQAYFGKGGDSLASNPSQRPTVVDGAQRMEYRTGKAAQVAVDISGDSMVYEQQEYSGYNWMCLECRLVWDRKWQAVECNERGHVDAFNVSYGGTVWDGRGFMPAGGLERGKYVPGTGTTYTRTAVRREPSPDAPPVAPAPAPSYNQVEETEAQADPQVMTSEEMWDALTGPGTITTTWN